MWLEYASQYAACLDSFPCEKPGLRQMARAWYIIIYIYIYIHSNEFYSIDLFYSIPQFTCSKSICVWACKAKVWHKYSWGAGLGLLDYWRGTYDSTTTVDPTSQLKVIQVCVRLCRVACQPFTSKSSCNMFIHHWDLEIENTSQIFQVISHYIKICGNPSNLLHKFINYSRSVVHSDIRPTPHTSSYPGEKCSSKNIQGSDRGTWNEWINTVPAIHLLSLGRWPNSSIHINFAASCCLCALPASGEMQRSGWASTTVTSNLCNEMHRNSPAYRKEVQISKHFKADIFFKI